MAINERSPEAEGQDTGEQTDWNRGGTGDIGSRDRPVSSSTWNPGGVGNASEAELKPEQDPGAQEPEPRQA